MQDEKSQVETLLERVETAQWKWGVIIYECSLIIIIYSCMFTADEILKLLSKDNKTKLPL